MIIILLLNNDNKIIKLMMIIIIKIIINIHKFDNYLLNIYSRSMADTAKKYAFY
jgi:hypothetical protein